MKNGYAKCQMLSKGVTRFHITQIFGNWQRSVCFFLSTRLRWNVSILE